MARSSWGKKALPRALFGPGRLGPRSWRPSPGGHSVGRAVGPEADSTEWPRACRRACTHQTAQGARGCELWALTHHQDPSPSAHNATCETMEEPRDTIRTSFFSHMLLCLGARRSSQAQDGPKTASHDPPRALQDDQGTSQDLSNTLRKPQPAPMAAYKRPFTGQTDRAQFNLA